MEKIPETIRNIKKFNEKKPAGFDGIFDWSWCSGCFGDTKITPMDIDGIVERRGQFLIFETKDEETEVPLGQMITLERLHNLGCVTLLFIWGKTKPEKYELWFPNSDIKEQGKGVLATRTAVERWFEWADKQSRF